MVININITKCSLLTALLFYLVCCNEKKSEHSTSELLIPSSFSGWKDDSIKTFLTDKWVHIGIFNKGKIESDTLGIIYKRKEDIDTMVIEIDGKYFLHNGQKIKQTEMPCINLNFENGEAYLLEDDCYQPTFDSCLISFKSMFKFLVIKNGIFYVNTANQIKEIDIRFINQFIIVINKTVYIRKNNWVKFSKTKGII